MAGKSKSKKSAKGKKKWASKSKNENSSLPPPSDFINHEELLIQELMFHTEDLEIVSEQCSPTRTPEPGQAPDDAVSVEGHPESPGTEAPSIAHSLPTEVNTEVTKPTSDDSDSDHYSDCEPEEYKLCLESGHGVTIVSSHGHAEDGQQFRLNAATLGELVERGGLGARPVVLVSVAGAFRTGKSFLLDYMLRYLYAQARGGCAGDEWLGDEEEPLRGFSWRGGCRRDTTGLVLWSQPIPVTLPTGEEVAVLLLDTQGAWDDQSSLRDCSLVFALSTLLSSVQVYNISQQIKEDDLQHLQLFTEYAAAGGGGLAALRLLLRDWSAPHEFPYGAAGGDRYLRDKLQVREEQPRELRETRQRLAASFADMSCFLLPHPGLRAARDPAFQGRLSELDPEFKQSLRELVPLLLAPARLRVKAVGGRPLAARELPLLLQTYLHEFSARVLTPLSVLSASARAAWLLGAAAARAAVCAAAPARALPRGPLRARLAAAARAAREPLQALADRANDLQGLADLEKELDSLVDQYIEANDLKMHFAVAKAKDVFESVVRELEDEEKLCLNPLDLAATITEARDAAMASFDSEVELDVLDPERVQLETDVEERSSAVLPRLSALNAVNNGAAVEAACAALRSLPRPCAHAADLAAAHAAAARAAAHAFRTRRNRDSAHQHDEYIIKLEKKIKVCLCSHEKNNFFNNRTAKNYALSLYDASITFANGCWRPDLLAAKHEDVKQRALESFYDHREGPNSHTRDEFVEEIELELSIRYDELREVNENKNETAVDDTYKKFSRTMDEACCLFRMENSELQVKLNKAFTDGKSEFMNKRIRTYVLCDEDYYFNLLQQKMLDRYEYYRAKNRQNLSGSEVAGAAAAVGGAALAAVVSPRYGLPLLGAIAAILTKKPGSG